MEIQTLNKWADLLLDMGKRNNLINFRNTKMGTAEIVAPDLSALFSQISHTAEFEVYDPKLEDDDDDFDKNGELRKNRDSCDKRHKSDENDCARVSKQVENQPKPRSSSVDAVANHIHRRGRLSTRRTRRNRRIV